MVKHFTLLLINQTSSTCSSLMMTIPTNSASAWAMKACSGTASWGMSEPNKNTSNVRDSTELHTSGVHFTCSWDQCHEYTWSGCILIWEVIISVGAAAVTAGVSVREENPFSWILTNLFPGTRADIPRYSKTIITPLQLHSTVQINHHLIF